MTEPTTIDEALEKAAELRGEVKDLRQQADQIEARADDIEREWTGTHEGDIITVTKLVEIIRKISAESIGG